MVMRIEVTKERDDWFAVLILDGNNIISHIQGATTRNEALALAFALAAKRYNHPFGETTP